jgi:HlyD family secretion protein
VKKTGKIVVGVLAVLVLAGGVAASIRYSQRDLVTVQTSKVVRTSLTSVVTASGEIKPKNYINLGANAQGRIAALYVKEGDKVHKDQIVAQIENIQATADVQAQRMAVASAEADSAASEAGIKAQDDAITTQVATIDRAKAELDRAKINLDRANKLWEAQVAPRQDLDKAKSDYDSADASLRSEQARLTQLRTQKAQYAAQLNSQQRRVAQVQAQLTRANDILAKYDVVAPLDGLVTYLPVRVGETVVMGIQNSAASTVMTIADMSLITAEVKADETDVVNIKIGQQAAVTIDAIPGKTFQGHVTEIGNTAILRSSGLAASTSATSSQEAKDFKVVVALDDPPDEIRPGLSATAKITTDTRDNAVTIPLQALTVRTKGDLEQAEREKSKVKAEDNGPLDPIKEKERKEEVQGVFVVTPDNKAEFKKVETGITGQTDIEALSGVSAGDTIVTGSYKAIRTLKPGARVKIDNKSPVVNDSKS